MGSRGRRWWGPGVGVVGRWLKDRGGGVNGWG